MLQARGTVFPETEERDEIETVRKIADGDAGDQVPPEPTGTDLTGFGEGDKQ